MLVICTWWWGTKYDVSYVRKLAAGVHRNLKQPCRFLVMTERERKLDPLDDIEVHAIKDPGLCKMKGCLARMRMFDPGWQKNRGIDDRLVCLDLDLVITGPLDPLFDRPEPFVILQGVNAVNPCPYNGSVMMLRAGAHPEAWTDMTVAALATTPKHEFVDDQGWLAHRVPGAAAWTPQRDGVYGFKKPGWPEGDNIPNNARIVAFFGSRDPSQFTKLGWIHDNWTMGEERAAA